ncbi:MAG TPA: ATP-binding protein [Longimicrobiaceae bacterium]
MAETLPTCDLVSVLRLKAEARADTTFDYLGHLRNLRERVGGEVRFINQLFPEYTPHDLEYHLSRLFRVADTLIGRDRYERMQATELFVLACGLYAHDWGMAVSGPEREFVTTGTLPDGAKADDFALLRDEGARFRRFLSDRGLNPDQVRTNGLSDEDWREYVRGTHALRSAERARMFFETVDSGAGEAVARVCEGHWLDFEVLQNYTRYPTAFSVLGESLNLAALAVYVRLVDLLDIASDRTPYVIWKFVAPRNPQSRMEWAKHRSLQPVTCPPYQDGRRVQVDGSTDDHEVYAALEDLRIYCESQVRGCTDLLARLNDPRHRLDLYHVAWNVAARGFEPVPVRFEFDRERVFEILGDEIYQGDAHVFLRELLQNSIDAIRTRRGILRREGIEPQAFGLIRVDVEHGPGRDARVVWTDNGVGMDAYVVRNYLAVAGKSFYRSDDFRGLGLAMDPISRFGIGILSCFMVADEVDIETRKDPNLEPPGEPLSIRIPAVTRQFRVEKLSPGSIDVGTRVTVYVQGRRLPEDDEGLQVARYLKAVAGFVEFPILVTESGYQTLILHPTADIDPATDARLEDLPKSFEVYRTPLGFPFEEAVLPQDLEAARAEIVERSYDLQRDLGLTNVEGRITFLKLRDSRAWVRGEHMGGGRGISIHRDALTGASAIVRWNEPWTYYYHPSGEVPWSRSAVPAPTHAIYRDGVLIAEAEIPRRDTFDDRDYLPEARQVINLTSLGAPELDVARTNLRTEEHSWYIPIQHAVDQRLREDLLNELGLFENEQRLAHYGLFLAFHPHKALIDLSKSTDAPVAVLTEKGQVIIRTWESLGDAPVRVCPAVLKIFVADLLAKQTLGIEYNGAMCEWVGEEAVIADLGGDWLSLKAAVQATRSVLEQEYHLAEVSLLEPPAADLPPLVQEIWRRGGPYSDHPRAELAAAAMKDPFSISARERAALLIDSGALWGHRFVSFPDESVFRSANLFNLTHPLAALVFQGVAYLTAIRDKGDRWDSASGRLRDAVDEFAQFSRFSLFSEVQWQYSAANVNTLIEAAMRVGLSIDPAVAAADAIVWNGGYNPALQIPDDWGRWKKKEFGTPLGAQNRVSD